jgi:coenzyme F420-reducing hydrogenase delta subunit/Pyruvate/2-oxoacid:ferredoxin oxidoreductase delta subunit
MYASSAGATWALALGSLVALFVLPFLPSKAIREPVAVVDPQNCNGCQRCFVDCPYAAVTMVPHPNQRIGRQLAVVDADLCASCGICAGSCPSSTPFRSGQALATGIDMPMLPVDTLRRQLHAGLAAMRVEHPIAVFSCREGADARCVQAPDTLVLPLICTGQLPPSFVEYALRDGAAGVVVASCRDGGCTFRLGARWTAERLAGTREPHLRADVPRDQVLHVPADAGEEAVLRGGVDAMRDRLKQIKAVEGSSSRR